MELSVLYLIDLMTLYTFTTTEKLVRSVLVVEQPALMMHQFESPTAHLWEILQLDLGEW